MDTYEYIKKFANISVNKICKEYKIQLPNIYNKKTKKENAELVKKEIEKELIKLYSEVLK